MVNSLTQAVQFGLRDKQVNGKDFAIVVPLYSRLMAQGAGKNVAGHLRLYELALVAAGRRLKGIREILRQGLRLPAVTGSTHDVLPGHPLRRCMPARRIFRTLRCCKGSRRLQVRRTWQRPDRVPCRRPPVLQRCPRGERQGKAGNKFDVLEVVEVTPRKQVEYPASMLGGQLGTCNNGA